MNHFLSSITVAAFIIVMNFSVAQSYTAKDVSGGGKLSGKVTFKGAVPEPTNFPIEKNPDICGTGVRIVRSVTVDGSGGLQHAVVYFNKVAEGKAWPAPLENKWGKPKGWQLNQKKCTFTPWMTVISNKSNLEVINRDPVLHNIHTYELIGKVRVTMFNEAQPKQGYTFNKKIKMRRGTTMKVECDAHNFMHAYIKVLKNPYFAITAADGSYSIDQVPAGKYKVTVWHSDLGEMSKEIEVAGGGSVTLDHTFSK